MVAWDPKQLRVALTTQYYKASDPRAAAVIAWEEAVIAYLEGDDYAHAESVRVTFAVEASVQAEIAKSVESAGSLPSGSP